LLALTGALFMAALSCACGGPRAEHRSEWVLHSRVVFYSRDLNIERASLPATDFRLFFPYIVGDLYGSPDTGDFLHVEYGEQQHFAIDLNLTHEELLKSLEKTEFGLSYLTIEPAEARIARLAPLALQADGIEQIGTAEWIEPQSKQRLMLVYVDRPCRIAGTTRSGERLIRYEVRAPTAGYIWIGYHDLGDGSRVYAVVPAPNEIVLGVTPPESPPGAI
jgi:hypothetical protein